MNVLDFCLKIENAIPDEICDDLIRIFDESEQKSRLDRNGYPNWTNLFISELIHDEKELIQNKIEEQNWHILRAYQEYLGEYGKYFVSDQNFFKFEEANIKCYVGGTDDRYDFHADVSSLLTSRRYLAMIWYLNDDFTGGKTSFFPDCSLQPKKGSVLVFPPYWMFPHSGEPVIEGKKYIMSTYCEWSDGQD
tara:strand:+ start:100 stop:675 length:576 start_codon:yes stop_codon:yes gene_type:complete